MLRLLLIFLFLFITNLYGYAQEKYNFKVAPQKVTCDSLQIKGKTLEESLKLITTATFRSDQQFKLSRPTGLHQADYYSCDGKTGFLVVTIDDRSEICDAVPKSIWDAFWTTSDLESFYQEEVREKYLSHH